MQWVVHANSSQRDEFSKGFNEHTNLIWIDSAREFRLHKSADLFVDLLYENTDDRTRILKDLQPKTLIINSVIHTIAEIGLPCIRINGWPGFLSGDRIEAAGDATLLPDGFSTDCKKTIDWVDDIPGFISPRVVAMIINEAYLALEQKVTSREDIDIAMKLGTNYPFGAFEWADKIGPVNIYQLLQKLSLSQSRYTPSVLLMEEGRQ